MTSAIKVKVIFTAESEQKKTQVVNVISGMISKIVYGNQIYFKVKKDYLQAYASTALLAGYIISKEGGLSSGYEKRYFCNFIISGLLH